GADSLIFHYEVMNQPRPLIDRIRQLGKHVGVAVSPDTPVAVLEPFLATLDVALCMTVHPGYAGQAFLPQSPARIRQLRELIDRQTPRCELEVDGGIDLYTGPPAVQAGANVLVAATAVFGDADGPEAAVRKLREITSS